MSEENKAVVRRDLEELWTHTGNIEAADEIFASNFVAHDTGGDEIHGPEGMKQWATMFRSAFPDLQATIEDQIAEGDKVATRYTLSGTHQGELMGIAPTGNQVEIKCHDLDRIEGGKMAESWTHSDVLGLMQQLGTIPTPGGQAES